MFPMMESVHDGSTSPHPLVHLWHCQFPVQVTRHLLVKAMWLTGGTDADVFPALCRAIGSAAIRQAIGPCRLSLRCSTPPLRCQRSTAIPVPTLPSLASKSNVAFLGGVMLGHLARECQVRSGAPLPMWPGCRWPSVGPLVAGPLGHNTRQGAGPHQMGVAVECRHGVPQNLGVPGGNIPVSHWTCHQTLGRVPGVVGASKTDELFSQEGLIRQPLWTRKSQCEQVRSNRILLLASPVTTRQPNHGPRRNRLTLSQPFGRQQWSNCGDSSQLDDWIRDQVQVQGR
jgi:hypothetical protein